MNETPFAPLPLRILLLRIVVIRFFITRFIPTPEAINLAIRGWSQLGRSGSICFAIKGFSLEMLNVWGLALRMVCWLFGRLLLFRLVLSHRGKESIRSVMITGWSSKASQ